MGTGASKDADEGSKEERERLDHAGGQLYVSLKMENHKLTGDLVPHVYGSVPLVGSWDPSKAVILIPTLFFLWFVCYWVCLLFRCFSLLFWVLVLAFHGAGIVSMWELSFVVPPNHGNAFYFFGFCFQFFFSYSNIAIFNYYLFTFFERHIFLQLLDWRLFQVFP